jgi:hypothetical protein
MRLFDFKTFYTDDKERTKDFIKNLPEPLKTKLRQEMIDDVLFTEKLNSVTKRLYKNLLNRGNIENFFIYLRNYSNVEPTEIIDIIENYLERKKK